MKNESVTYQDGQQKLIGELIYQDSIKSPSPAIIIFHAFEGRGEFTVNYAKQLAEQGFVAFVADMYGDAQVASTIDGCFNLISPFLQDRALVRRRANLAFQVLSQHPLVDKNNIGAIGFCFGGMCVLELARSGENLRAGVSVHGVLKKSDLSTQKIKANLLVLHGYQDPQVPPENLSLFAEEMDKAGCDDWTFTFFGHAKHSFTDPKTGTFEPAKEKEMGREYSEIAAERSFRYAVDFFEDCLK